MSEAASHLERPSELNSSLVERYTAGIELSEHLIQGIRFEILGGRPSFRAGARPYESANDYCSQRLRLRGS